MILEPCKAYRLLLISGFVTLDCQKSVKMEGFQDTKPNGNLVFSIVSEIFELELRLRTPALLLLTISMTFLQSKCFLADFGPLLSVQALSYRRKSGMYFKCHSDKSSCHIQRVTINPIPICSKFKLKQNIIQFLATEKPKKKESETKK